MNIQARSLILLLTFIVAGCNLSEATPVPAVQSTVPYVHIAQADTPVPQGTPTRLIQPLDTRTPPPPSPQPTRSPFVCGGEPDGEHIQHEVLATLDYEAKTIQVAQRILYRNEDEVAFRELVLDVEANAWDGAFVLEALSLGGTEPPYALERNQLTVALPEPMNPGCEVTLDLEFVIRVPQMGIGLSSFKGYFGYSERQMNLAMWLPTAAPRINQRWLVHDPQAIGEQSVLEQADWDVTLRVENAPEALVIAAPGTVEALADNQWRYVFRSARDFSLSLSDRYRLSEATTATGVQVQVYHFADTVRSLQAGTVDGAAHTVEVAVQAVEQYTSLYGRYPFERLIIVQGDFPDGMEFSGLVFVSTNWFYTFEGGVQNYLTLITVHEISHQWWYARVGNDAAYAPWLDEALATYSEYVYYEEFYPDLKNWWWSFRVAWYNPQGNVDSSVYEFETARDYINAVYLRGVQMLHNLREDIGTEAFFDLLADYAQAGDGQIATPELFWSLLTPEQMAATQNTRAEFLGVPDVLPQAEGTP